MPTAQTTRNARARIDSLIAALEAMLQTLTEEHRALNNADAPALAGIAAGKAEAVETISRLYERFKQELGLNRLESIDDDSSQDFSAALDDIRGTTPQLAGRLDRLVSLTRACRQSNQDNGTLVNLGLNNCQSNLNLLQQLSQPSQAGTYGPGAQAEDRFDSLHRLQLRA